MPQHNVMATVNETLLKLISPWGKPEGSFLPEYVVTRHFLADQLGALAHAGIDADSCTSCDLYWALAMKSLNARASRSTSGDWIGNVAQGNKPSSQYSSLSHVRERTLLVFVSIWVVECSPVCYFNYDAGGSARYKFYVEVSGKRLSTADVAGVLKRLRGWLSSRVGCSPPSGWPNVVQLGGECGVVTRGLDE